MGASGFRAPGAVCPVGLGSEGVLESRGTPDPEHQGQRRPDSLREVLRRLHPPKGLGAPPQGGNKKRSIPIPVCPHPLSHPLLGINHVYKLWKIWDILQKKTNKKYT